MRHSRSVAVIGAGAGGLVSARELSCEGHHVVVFERNTQIGGTWVYSPEIESDDPNRTRVHSSLFNSLRTNIPRELMGVRDYPFVPREGKDRDQRRFPSHREVLKSLGNGGLNFDLKMGLLIMTFLMLWLFVLGIIPTLELQRFMGLIGGIDRWPGEQLHSHNYRDPESFRGKVVVLIGYSSSGTDISQELIEVAKEIHIARKSARTTKLLNTESIINNVSFHPMVESVRKDGTVVFQDGCVVSADVILHCTGYANVVSFPMFELQRNWVAGVLSNRIALPSKEEMLADVNAFYEELEAFGKAQASDP
ncbi:unnamed protein product [Citrullus colocynthis]|uniref:Flavin-containing monooxygenase n=1 Tax=Citrullus colocynthis TaxID=252529 RepID=A0ABP0YM88_9ROSI